MKFQLQEKVVIEAANFQVLYTPEHKFRSIIVHVYLKYSVLYTYLL